MTGYDNTNTGALFKNDKKGNEKAPDYKGKINVGGKEYKLASWIRESKEGVKYMSLKIEAAGEWGEVKQTQEIKGDEVAF